MNLTTNEKILTTLFNCGYADLSMLDDCFSELAEEVCDPMDILEELLNNGNLNLNNFLYEVYREITDSVYTNAHVMLSSESELVVNGTGNKALFINTTEIELPENVDTNNVLEQINNRINENTPFTNCMDTHFQNELDEVIDWSESVEYNAINVIKYLIENYED